MRYVLDTTAIIKGLLKPRRRKQDEILKEQLRIYKIASGIIDEIAKGKSELIVPTVAVIETAAVASRLSGDRSIGIQTAVMVIIIAKILNEGDILEQCIEMAAATTSSGFDSLFITCAKVSDSTLITDDKKMHDTAVKQGIKSKLLRGME